MAFKLYRKQALGIKQETTQGTAAAPDAATDFIKVSSVDYTLEKEVLERDYLRSTIGALPHVIGKRWAGVKFRKEMTGSGTAGDATIAGFKGLDAAIQACGMVSVSAIAGINSVTITAPGTGYTSNFAVTFTGAPGTGATGIAVVSGGAVVKIYITNPGSGYVSPTVDLSAGAGTGATATATAGGTIFYAPTSAAASANYYGPGKSVTIHWFADGLKHEITGALGTFQIVADESGKYPMLEFTFTGLYTAVADDTQPSPTFVDVAPQSWESAAAMMAGLNSPVLNKFTLDMANTIAPIPDALSANALYGFILTERKSKGTFECTVSTVAAFNAYGTLIAGTQAPTGVTFGSGGGKKWTILAQASQISDIAYAERSGLMTYNAGFVAPDSTGDDGVIILLT